MTSEVEKLYENAGIEHYRLENFCGLIPDGYKIIPDEVNKDYVKEIVRDFTAEKQLELIKFLGSLKDYTVEIEKFKGVYYVGCREAVSNNKYWGSHNIFEEALAELVNVLWQNLPEEEKQQIRGILK